MLIEFAIRQSHPGVVDQLLIHLGRIQAADGPQEKGLIVSEGLLQIRAVADAGGNQPVGIIQQPRNILQFICGVHDPAHLIAMQGRDRPDVYPLRHILREHRPITRPRIFIDIAAVVQRITGNVCQRTADIPVGIQADCLDIRTLEYARLTIFPAEPHGGHPLDLSTVIVRILLIPGQYDGMTMIGYHGIYHQDHVFPPG